MEQLFGKGPFFGLAPMAGYTDLAFRDLAASHGADFTVTEMISAKGLFYKNEKTSGIMSLGRGKTGVQLFGSEEEPLCFAAKEAAKLSPAFIDFNMGCPTPKIVGSGDGSALLRDPERAVACLKALKEGAGDTAVTVKMRIGWEAFDESAVKLAASLADAGAAAIFVHGRTARQMYRPPVDYGAVKAVKEAVYVPVFANGDIKTPENAKEVLEFTGADGVLIGRAALGNPFIFEEIKSYFETGRYETPSSEALFDAAMRQLDAAIESKGEKLACTEARGQLVFYLKGVKDAAEKRRLLFAAKSRADVEKIFRKAQNGG